MIKEGKFYVNDEERLFHFENEPNLTDLNKVIENVASSVFSQGIYMPYLFEYVVNYSIVSTFTDVELPTNIDKCYRFLDESRIIKFLRREIPEVFDFVEKNANKLIEYNKDYSIRHSYIDDLIAAFVNVINTFESKFANLDINDVLNKLEKVGFVPNMKEEDIVKSILKIIGKEQEESNNEESD